MKKLSFTFISTLFTILIFTSVGQAQSTGYNEFVSIRFPVSNAVVKASGDYNIQMMVTADHPTIQNVALVNFVDIWAGPGTNQNAEYIHAGLYVDVYGYTWFAAAADRSTAAPNVTCLRGSAYLPDSNGRPTGCIGSNGDLGIGKNVWMRIELVTYGNYWIVRVQNPATNEKADVAKIYNPNTSISRADVALEESWIANSPSAPNPWYTAAFYDLDFKYRSDAFWNQMPSNIGGDYGSTVISQSSSSGATPCPTHYGVTPYVQSNPYLWFMGTNGGTCSGLLYSGGGPSTSTTSFLAEGIGKYLSSENGQGCMTTNRAFPGQWEEWHVDILGTNILGLRGNNGKYATRRTNNDLWEEASNTSSNEAKFDYVIIAPYLYRITNKGNSLLVNYSSTACAKANGSSVNDATQKFRLVAY